MSAKKDNFKRGITRRDFIKWSAAAGAAAKAVDWSRVAPSMAAPTVANTYRNICPYCSISCGVKCDVDDAAHDSGTIVDIYGDETSVLNNGSLCSKGSALYQLTDPVGSVGARVTEPRIKLGDGSDGTWYKNSTSEEAGWLSSFGVGAWGDGAYADTVDMTQWETVDGAVAGSGTVPTIAKQLADARNNNPDSVAFWGSSHLTNEECYLYRKLITVFGTNNIEHQARI